MVASYVSVCGASFGDEGKGLVTDYLVDKFENLGQSVVVVKHNGGAQAGHTVVTPEGLTHTFHHFGSGTFRGAPTYFDKGFLLNPIIFHDEFMELVAMGSRPDCYAHPDCRIQIPVDVALNQFLEQSRGDSRHGSCGLGIHETILRDSFMPFRLSSILEEGPEIYSSYVKALTESDYIEKRVAEEGIGSYLDDVTDILWDPMIIRNYLEFLDFMLRRIEVIDRMDVDNAFDVALFETGQGLLLDESNIEYFPNLTHSHTGTQNMQDFIREVGNDAAKIVTNYVTRTYATRHGNGRLDYECIAPEVSTRLTKDINVPNDFQGVLRYGFLDPIDLLIRCGEDVRRFDSVDEDRVRKFLFITHCDETEGEMRMVEPIDVVAMFEDFGFDIYFSFGPSRDCMVKLD